MAFIDTLLPLMKKHNVSRNKFCADIGIGKNSVADWEKRGNTPDGEVLSKIAAYFDVTTDYLLGRVGHPQVEFIPADPEKAREHELWQEQARLDNYRKIAEAAKKLFPDDEEQLFDEETLEVARVFSGLSPEDRKLMLGFLGRLKNEDNL